MHTLHPTDPDSPADRYRRQARRLRWRLAARPAELYAALRQLSLAADGTFQSAASRPPPPHSMRHEHFIRLVEQQMDGPILRYSTRAALIKYAMHSGIGRFEANLIIAAVQHRHLSRDPRPPMNESPAPSRTTPGGLVHTLALAGAIQVILIFATWLTLLR